MIKEREYNYRSSFSVVEWLVVITIIGILASIIGVFLIGARVKGRDTKRQTDIRRISTAMELYYNKNIAYIQSADVPISIGDFLNPVPKDPSGVSYGWVDNGISGANDDQDYCAFAVFEKSPDNSENTVYFLVGPGGVDERELSSDFNFTLSNCE